MSSRVASLPDPGRSSGSKSGAGASGGAFGVFNALNSIADRVGCASIRLHDVVVHQRPNRLLNSGVCRHVVDGQRQGHCRWREKPTPHFKRPARHAHCGSSDGKQVSGTTCTVPLQTGCVCHAHPFSKTSTEYLAFTLVSGIHH